MLRWRRSRTRFRLPTATRRSGLSRPPPPMILVTSSRIRTDRYKRVVSWRHFGWPVSSFEIQRDPPSPQFYVREASHCSLYLLTSSLLQGWTRSVPPTSGGDPALDMEFDVPGGYHYGASPLKVQAPVQCTYSTSSSCYLHGEDVARPRLCARRARRSVSSFSSFWTTLIRPHVTLVTINGILVKPAEPRRRT